MRNQQQQGPASSDLRKLNMRKDNAGKLDMLEGKSNDSYSPGENVTKVTVKQNDANNNAILEHPPDCLCILRKKSRGMSFLPPGVVASPHGYCEFVAMGSKR